MIRSLDPLTFLYTIFSYSLSALYCLCKDGLSDDDLQKPLEFACKNGGDCDPIQPNGPCYEPNTVKDHCSYAVNSFYQNMQNTGWACDFLGVTTTSPTPPTSTSGCVYPSSPSDSGTTTTPPSITSPSTPKPPSTGTTPCSATNGSTDISYSGAVVALLLVLTPVWLALRANKVQMSNESTNACPMFRFS